MRMTAGPMSQRVSVMIIPLMLFIPMRKLGRRAKSSARNEEVYWPVWTLLTPWTWSLKPWVIIPEASIFFYSSSTVGKK